VIYKKESVKKEQDIKKEPGVFVNSWSFFFNGI